MVQWLLVVIHAWNQFYIIECVAYNVYETLLISLIL